MKRIDEIMGGEYPDEPQEPRGPGANRMQWKPEAPNAVPVRRNPRFDLPEPSADEPEMRFAGQQDLDALIARIRAEEEQPPHKINQARIAALKREAMELMGQMESVWVQQRADELLPLCED